MIQMNEERTHAVPLTQRWYGGPQQKIGSSGELVLARARRMSVASSIIAAAESVYSPGIGKYNENGCVFSSSGGTSRVIPLNTPTRKVNVKP